MEDKITYGVLWKTKLDPDIWQLIYGWFESHESAKKAAEIAMRNPRSIKVVIVERRETFEVLEAWGGDE